jgi:hypothetical protein
MAEWVVGLSRARERERGRVIGLLVTAAAILLAVVPLLSLVHRTVTMVPSARWVGGSMWFISDVRAERPSAFESGRDEIRFARAVHRSTDRRTVVYVDGALAKRETETRFETTLDRTTISATWRSARTSVPPRGHDGAVAIGVRSAITDADAIELARAHPFTVWDDYYMVDYRREVEDVQIYRSAVVAPTWRWRFFHSPFEFDTRWARDRDAERALRDAIAIRPVAPRARPGSLGLPPDAVRALIP